MEQIVGMLALTIMVVAQSAMIAISCIDSVRWPKLLVWLPLVVGLIAMFITMIPMLESDPTSRGYLGMATTMLAVAWIIVGQVGASLLALVWRATRGRSA